MSEHIKTVCMVSMLAGVIGAIIPSGKMKGAFTAFCGVAVVFFIFSPLADIKADSLRIFDYENKKHEQELLSDVRTAEIMLYEQMLENALEEKSEKGGIYVSFDVFCENHADEIKVISVTVTGCRSQQERKVTETLLTDSFGSVEVRFEEENNG